jgi:hypothetical protein
MKDLEQLILSKSRPVQKEAKHFGVSELDGLIMEALLNEAGKESQEYAVINAVNDAVKKNNNLPITLVIGDWQRNDIVGAGKVNGSGPYGKEPYTDIIFHVGTKPPSKLDIDGTDTAALKSPGVINISAKQAKGAPSVLNMSREALVSFYPNWLKDITKAAVERLVSAGVPSDHWSTPLNATPTLNSFLRKISSLVSDKNKDVYLRVAGKDYLLSGVAAANKQVVSKKEYDKVKQQFKRGKVDKKTLDAAAAKLKAAQVDFDVKIKADLKNISQLRVGGFKEPTEEKKGYVFVSQNEDIAVPDVYSKVSEKEIKRLFIGSPYLGGPIEYIYQGPKSPPYDFKDGVLELAGKMTTGEYWMSQQKIEVDDGASSPKRIYLRVRKRTFDTTFAGADQNPDLKGYPIYGPPALVPGSKKVLARLVTTFKKDPPVQPDSTVAPTDQRSRLDFAMPPIPFDEDVQDPEAIITIGADPIRELKTEDD